jgi:acetyltransferase-like isoleucine patch superfamily enzyme
MDHKERMLAGLPYKAHLGQLPEEQLANRVRVYQFNHCPPQDLQKVEEYTRDMLGKAGKNVRIMAPFSCDYGRHIEVGDNFFANYNCVILDVAKVIIGDNVMFAPNVTISTAGHPIHPESRNSGYEYGIPIKIGNSVWLGANVVVNPGVTIGDNVVIGSGSVVTKDIPGNVIAVGNPCRVLRAISDEDRHFYYKTNKFDVTDY